jgi:DNA-binding transcriptional MerR regulator
MAHTLTIGQVARSSGIAAKTIRYYEEIGVLPVPRRAASGYRLYDQSGVERLRFIRRARTLGLPLCQLKTLTTMLNGKPPAGFRARLLSLVRDQLVAVSERMAELELLRVQLEEIVRQMETLAALRHAGGCRCLDTESAPPFPELLPEFEPHKVREVYLIQWEQPRVIVDMTETMELKLEACRCHASQLADLKAFETRMRDRAERLGKEKGFSYAEGFDHIIVPG